MGTCIHSFQFTAPCLYLFLLAAVRCNHWWISAGGTTRPTGCVWILAPVALFGADLVTWPCVAVSVPQCLVSPSRSEFSFIQSDGIFKSADNDVVLWKFPCGHVNDWPGRFSSRWMIKRYVWHRMCTRQGCLPWYCSVGQFERQFICWSHLKFAVL